MTATPAVGDELVSLIDALGRRVTAIVTPSGLLTILTLTMDEGLRGGHPALDRKQAAELRDALTAFIEEAP